MSFFFFIFWRSGGRGGDGGGIGDGMVMLKEWMGDVCVWD